MTDKSSKFSLYAAAFTAVCAVAFWASFQFRYALNADNAIMLEFARRLIAGGRIGTDFYDVNPPLSILLYTPIILMQKLFALPVWHGVTLYTTILCAASAALCHRLLIRTVLAPRSEAAVIALVYFLAALFAPRINFGERDHLIILGLLPLILAQYGINRAVTLPAPLLYPSLIFGGIMILVKPHYALMPALMIAHRFWTQGPRSLLRPDVVILSACALAYAALLATWFAPFLTVMLDDIIALYARRTPGYSALIAPLWPAGPALVIFSGLGLIAANAEQRKFFVLMSAFGACLLIAYAAQLKGFYYHLLPALITACMMAPALAFAIMPSLRARPAAVALAATLALALYFPVKFTYPTHTHYKTLPLSQLIATDCPAPCSFYLSNEFSVMNFETAFYENAFYASRFPDIWFQPPLSCGEHPALFDKYAQMMADDFHHYKPALVVLFKGDNTCPGRAAEPFDFAAYFARNPAFAQEWTSYRYEKDLTFNRRVYYTGTSADYDHDVTYAVYKRKTP